MGLLPTITVLTLLGAIGYWGHHSGWRIPKFSELTSDSKTEAVHWCEEHGVPEAECIACNADLMPKGQLYGWCKEHGVHECVLHHPGVEDVEGGAPVELVELLVLEGPGDPAAVSGGIATVRNLLGKRPLFGICLGHQLLALASGARTVKMKFGHHGANHPVQDLATGQVMITSQNHGFAVDEDSLPDNVEPTHRSLFDGTLQGIAIKDAPAFSFQGHPEASPGPHDLLPLFERFIHDMDAQKRSTIRSVISS